MPAWLARPARLFDETGDATEIRGATTKKAPSEDDATETPPEPTAREKMLARAEALVAKKPNVDFTRLQEALTEVARTATDDQIAVLNDIVALAHAITKSHKNDGADYVEGLSGLVRAVGDSIDATALANIRTLLATPEGRTHRTFLLSTLSDLHSRGVLGWLKSGAVELETGREMIGYLSAYMGLGDKVANNTVGFPASLGKLLDGLQGGDGWAQVPHIWQGVAAILRRAGIKPVRTMYNAPKQGDHLGFFVKALDYAPNRVSLGELFATWNQAGFEARMGRKFNEEYIAPPRPLKDLSQLPDSLKVLAGAALRGEDTDGLARQMFDDMGLPPTELRDFLDLVKTMSDTLRGDATGPAAEAALALYLDNIIDITRIRTLTGGDIDDVTGFKLTPGLSFRDFNLFIQNMGNGTPSDRLLAIQGLPLYTRLLVNPVKGVTERMFLQIKAFDHPSKGAQFKVPGRERPLIARAIDQAGGVTQKAKDAANLFAKAGRGIAEERRRSVSEGRKDAPEQFEQPATFRKTASKKVKESGETLTTTQEFKEFEFDGDVSLSRFVDMLEALYMEIHGATLDTEGRTGVIVFVREAVRAAKAHEGGAGADGADRPAKLPVMLKLPGLSLELAFTDGGRPSIFVGDNVSITIKPGAANGSETSDKGTVFGVEIKTSGGDSYPALINKLLTDLTDGGKIADSQLLTHLMNALRDGSSLNDLGLTPRTLANLKLLKAIVGGSEVLRDDAALPALLMSLYAMRGLSRSATSEGQGPGVYPAQILFGHNFFRVARIAAFSSHLKMHDFDPAMEAAGLSKEEIKTLAAILGRNLSGNMARAGGGFVSTIPLFLSTRIRAGQLARGEIGIGDVTSNAHLVMAILNRYDALLDLAIQRYLIDNPELGDPDKIADLSTAQRQEFMESILREMMEIVMPELDRDRSMQPFRTKDDDGSGGANGGREDAD